VTSEDREISHSQRGVVDCDGFQVSSSHLAFSSHATPGVLKIQVREWEHATEFIRAIQLAKTIFLKVLGELQLLNGLKITKDLLRNNHLNER
jgi:hypothetical protein